MTHFQKNSSQTSFNMKSKSKSKPKIKLKSNSKLKLKQKKESKVRKIVKSTSSNTKRLIKRNLSRAVKNAIFTASFKKTTSQQLLFFLWQLNYKFYYLNRKRKMVFKTRYWRRFKKVSTLQRLFNVNWPPYNTFKPWFIGLPNSGTREAWLKERYETWKDFLKKPYYSFLQTKYGTILLAGYKLLFSRKVLNLSRQAHFWQLYSHMKYSWQYENLRHIKRVTHSQNSFQFHLEHLYWARELKEPWLNSLIFKRALIGHRSEDKRKINKMGLRELKVYKRAKNPVRTKKLRLYNTFEKLVYTKWVQNKRVRKKIARTNQIVKKIIFSFYNHTKTRHFQKIWTKSNKNKSLWNNQTDKFLSHFECRLDVLVYRTNWAPTILWARRLIWEGAIFVSNLEEAREWNRLYSFLKIINFPLKLRDPKKIYSQTYWNPSKLYTHYKFFLAPFSNEAYQVKANEIIQYNPHATLNQFKFQSSLFRKNMLKNTLITNSGIQSWMWQGWWGVTFQMDKTRQEFTHPNAMFLTTPTQQRHLNHIQDRIKERFLNWARL